MCLNVLGLLALVLKWPNQYYSDASAVCLFDCFSPWLLELFSYSRCSFLCVQNYHSLIIPTPNTLLGMLRITGGGYLEQEEVGSEHFLPVLLVLSHSVEKNPAREFTWEGACDALPWYSDEEEIIDSVFCSLHWFWSFYLNTKLLTVMTATSPKPLGWGFVFYSVNLTHKAYALLYLCCGCPRSLLLLPLIWLYLSFLKVK